MPMSSGGHVESSSDCATRPKAREIGLTGYAVPIQPSLHIGRYVMATAKHREPCDSRGSCTVLGAPGGETPSGDSSRAAHMMCSRIRLLFLRPRKDGGQLAAAAAKGTERATAVLPSVGNERGDPKAAP